MISAEIMEKFLRVLIADIDYDIHKSLECGEGDGLDHYPELAEEYTDYFNHLIGHPDAS